MLSLGKCRELLKDDLLSDSQLETLLQHLNDLADVVLTQYDSSMWEATARTDAGPEDVDLEERAAIREFEGQLSRPEAEEAAVIDFVTRRER